MVEYKLFYYLSNSKTQRCLIKILPSISLCKVLYQVDKQNKGSGIHIHMSGNLEMKLGMPEVYQEYSWSREMKVKQKSNT